MKSSSISSKLLHSESLLDHHQAHLLPSLHLEFQKVIHSAMQVLVQLSLGTILDKLTLETNTELLTIQAKEPNLEQLTTMVTSTGTGSQSGTTPTVLHASTGSISGPTRDISSERPTSHSTPRCQGTSPRLLEPTNDLLSSTGIRRTKRL